MQAFQEDQKGLFTFYREQADLEEEFKLYKRRLKTKKMEEQGQYGANNDNEEGGILDKFKIRYNSPILQAEEHFGENQLKPKKMQSKDKLISLISKQNAYQYRKNRKMQIFMNQYGERKGDETMNLKRKLQKLQRQQVGDNGKIQSLDEALNNIENQANGKKQNFLKAYKPQPFQRLSLIPTNFQPQIQNSSSLEKKIQFNPRKLFPKYSSNNLEIRKNDKVQYVSKSFNLRQARPLPTFSLKQDSLKPKGSKRPIFPKIQVKSIAEIMHKINKQHRYEQMEDHLSFNSKLISNVQQQQNGSKALLNQRQKKKNDISLLLQSVKVELEDNSKTSKQNKIHALFINNKLQQFQTKEKEVKKDVVFLDILKKMKFA